MVRQLRHRRTRRFPLALSAVLVVLLFASGGLLALRSSQGQPAPADEPVEGLIIKYKTGTDREQLRQRLSQVQALETRDISQLRVKVAKVKRSTRDSIRQKLAADPRVQYVEIDEIRTEDITTPNDPQYSEQWAWPKTATNSAWDSTKGSTNTIVAVIDSGINLQHPEFSGKLAAGYDFRNDDDSPADDRGHGTSVSGIIAASTNNSTAIAAGCWNCRIMPLKTQNEKGEGNSSDVIKAIQFATDNGAKVINMSIGGPNRLQSELEAINYARSRGVLVVASAGNNSTDRPQYPADYPGVLSVAATNQSDQLASYSNYGDSVEVAAPGTNRTLQYSSSSNVINFSGTSAAAPVVSAIAGLLVSAYPQASPDQISQAITSTADNCCDNRIKGGRVNSLKALGYLAGLFPVTPTPTPPTPTPPAPAPTPQPPTPPPSPSTKPGDLNNDQRVNLTDLSLLLGRWNTADSQADINRNGRVDLADLSALLIGWNR